MHVHEENYYNKLNNFHSENMKSTRTLISILDSLFRLTIFLNHRSIKLPKKKLGEETDDKKEKK